MAASSHRKQHVRQYCVKLLKREVFSNVFFVDKNLRNIVFDSYVQNLDDLIEYAVIRHLNIEEYFKEIRTILLTSKHVREL